MQLLILILFSDFVLLFKKKKKFFLKLIELGLLSKCVALFTLVVIFSFDAVALEGISWLYSQGTCQRY